MTPEATESATALATAACAGPNICTACFIPLIVTFVISTVDGLTARFGVRTASRFECPSLWRANALANAVPTGPSLLPINKSIWAISLPSPANASPMNIDIVVTPDVVKVCSASTGGLAAKTA